MNSRGWSEASVQQRRAQPPDTDPAFNDPEGVAQGTAPRESFGPFHPDPFRVTTVSVRLPGVPRVSLTLATLHPRLFTPLPFGEPKLQRAPSGATVAGAFGPTSGLSGRAKNFRDIPARSEVAQNFIVIVTYAYQRAA